MIALLAAIFVCNFEESQEIFPKAFPGQMRTLRATQIMSLL